ncbi:MAG: hypothetical protein ACQERV_12400 [Bacteroidota bacterium]
MKANSLITLTLFLAAGLLISCNKNDDNNDPTSTGTYEDLEAVFDRMGERQKLHVDLAPVELPDYVTESNDTMMQEIVSLADFINSSRERAIFPAFADSANLKNATLKSMENLLKSAGISSDGEWTEECFMEDTPYWICRFTKWKNDGKLEIVVTQQGSETAWLSHVRLNGEDSKGRVYDNLRIQSWMMLKDLTFSQYDYSTHFHSNCGNNVLWRLMDQVVGQDARLDFMGETKSLAMDIHTVITYMCDQIDGHHVWSEREMRIMPDRTLYFITRLYSYKLKSTYLWRVYVIDRNRTWSITIYDEDGNVIKYRQGS